MEGMVNMVVGPVTMDEHVGLIYALAGHDVSAPPGVGKLALGLLGEEAFDCPTGNLPFGSCAQLIRTLGGWRIRVFEAGPQAQICFDIAQALAHWYWGLFGGDHEDPPIESLAAHILLPTVFVRSCLDRHGYDASDFVSHYHAHARVAARRVQEVLAAEQSGAYVCAS